MVLVPSATAGGVPLVLARLVEGLSTHQCAGGPWRLEDRPQPQPSVTVRRSTTIRSRAKCRQAFNELATSTARRIAAATWIMSSTTVASRAYAVVPAKRSRWSRGGAYRPRSAPAAGSARHRADAGRRDRAARSPDPQPASCRRSFRRGFRARAAPSTRHHWRPRPDRQPVPGCVGRDVLAGACVPTSGPAGAVPVRVRSRSSAGFVGGEEGFGIREDSIGRYARGRAREIDARDAGSRLWHVESTSLESCRHSHHRSVPLPMEPYQNAARMSRRERARGGQTDGIRYRFEARLAAGKTRVRVGLVAVPPK